MTEIRELTQSDQEILAQLLELRNKLLPQIISALIPDDPAQFARQVNRLRDEGYLTIVPDTSPRLVLTAQGFDYMTRPGSDNA